MAPRNQAGRPTLAELERRKSTVLDIATQLFVSRGYAETSLVDIARIAGVATRTLYQHFGDKEAIFREVIFARRAAPNMPTPMPEKDESLFDVLMRAADESIQYVMMGGSIELMRLMVAESRRFPDLVSRVANATFARFSANIGNTFAELARRRQIPEGNHPETAQLFLDLILGNGPIMVYAGWRSEAPSRAEIERKVDLFILGRFGPAIARKARASGKPPRRETTGLSGENGLAA